LPAAPPPLSGAAAAPWPVKPAGGRVFIALLLNLLLGLFLVDAAVSLLDDSLGLLLGVRGLAGVRGLTSFAALVAGLLAYGTMGVTPLIPKRLFIPVALFGPLAMLISIPLCIYFYHQSQQIGWLISFCQASLGLAVMYWLRGSVKWHWPLVAEERLGATAFSWRNLVAFVLVNALVLLPAVIGYLFLCASLAVGHFGEGFLALRPSGISVQVRKYVRADGRAVELVPMSHIGEPAFYRQLSHSFPTNALILMEGVTDDQNLLTNKITYRRMAKTLGLAEQQKEFKPSRMHLVRADVDISQFHTNTIDLLNLMMLIHARGLNAQNLTTLLHYSAPPDFQEQLFDDLLNKRNQHLLGELRARVPDWNYIIVPWGAAHMPGISHGLQKAGFHLDGTREYQAIRFNFFGRKAAPPLEEAKADAAELQ
jgi:hypothetical protein